MFRTLRPLDLAALTIVTMVASTGVSVWLGLSDTPSLVALTMGLSCPAARRLIAWRRGVAPLRFGGDRSSTAVLLFAMVPWMLIPALRTMPWQSVAVIATGRLELPVIVRWTGVALTLAGVLRPMAGTLRGTDRIRSAAYVETFGLFLATGSLFLGALAASWVLLQARGASLASSSTNASAVDPIAMTAALPAQAR